MWLRVSPGRAISEQWLHECAPELSARRRDTPSVGGRDQVALHIKKRLEELEAAESRENLALRHQERRRGRRWPPGWRGTRQKPRPPWV
jgi:hypothetical protein